MNLRTLGRTGLQVSEVGFGAWGIGRSMWMGADDAESLRALHRAIDLGVNFVDTALAYGDGHSEQLVGKLVKERKERVIVATKIPPKNMTWPAAPGVHVNQAFPADHVVACTERSLKNLGVEAIDLQQLHVWTDGFLDQGDWRAAVDKLRKQGKIRFFGVSLGEPSPDDGLKAVASGAVDTVQVIYNIFEQRPADNLFPACIKHNVGVLARVPLDEGGLTGKVTPESTFPKGDFRNFYFAGDRKKQVFDRVSRIASDLGVPLERMPETALRFTLSHPAVSTVIPGIRTIAHAEANAPLGDGKGLPKAQLARLKPHRWVRNFYQG